MITEFLSKLEIVATSPLAFTAYIFVLIGWVLIKLKAKQVAVIDKFPNGPNNPIGDKLSPEQYVNLKKLWYFFWGFISVLVATIMLVAMSNSGRTSGTEISSNDEKLITKANEFTQKYLTSLMEETFDAKDFYAPIVEKFFKQTDITQGKINDFIRNDYYKNFLSRSVYTVPGSWKVIEKTDHYSVLSFNMVGTWTDAKTLRQKEAKSRIIIKLNKDFKFLYFSEDEIFKFETK